MNPQERIAEALERIAAALEARQPPSPKPPRKHANIQSVSAVNDYETRLRQIMGSLQKNHRLTMDEILIACSVNPEWADKGLRASVGFALGRCGFRQVKTAKQRFYLAP